jgi:hypothetical protein
VRGAVILVVAAVVVAAGCGRGTMTYSLAKTRTCLKKEHARISAVPISDFVASTATGGSFRARLPANFVTLVFGDTEGDAEQIQKAYERFAFANVRPGLADVLRRQGNAVMLWHQHPQDKNNSLVLGCLK